MTTLHMVQYVTGGATQFFKLRTGPLGNRFDGVMIQLDDPAASERLRLDVTMDNPAFFQSLESKLAKGEATFQVRDDAGQTLTVTAHRTQTADIFQAAAGPTLVVTTSEEDHVATLGAVIAVAVVAVAAILVIGGTAAVAMGGAFEGKGKTDEESTEISVSASSGGNGEDDK